MVERSRSLWEIAKECLLLLLVLAVGALVIWALVVYGNHNRPTTPKHVCPLCGAELRVSIEPVKDEKK